MDKAEQLFEKIAISSKLLSRAAQSAHKATLGASSAKKVFKKSDQYMKFTEAAHKAAKKERTTRSIGSQWISAAEKNPTFDRLLANRGIYSGNNAAAKGLKKRLPVFANNKEVTKDMLSDIGRFEGAADRTLSRVNRDIIALRTKPKY